MPAGAIIYNDYDTVLIDDTYRNLSVRQSGDQSTAPSAGGIVAYQNDNLTGTTHRWWRFDVPVVSEAYGFRVYDAAGNVTFDALQKYARVVDVVAGPATFTNAATQTASYSYPSGRSYAVVVSKYARAAAWEERVDPDRGPGWINFRWRGYGARASVTGNTVVVGWASFNEWSEWSPPLTTGEMPDPYTSDLQSSFIILDVTGY